MDLKIMYANYIKANCSPDLAKEIFELMGSDSFSTEEEIVEIMDKMNIDKRNRLLFLFDEILKVMERRKPLYKYSNIVYILFTANLVALFIYGFLSRSAEKNIYKYLPVFAFVIVAILLGVLNKIIHKKLYLTISLD